MHGASKICQIFVRLNFMIVPLSNLVIKGSSNTPGRPDTVIIQCTVTANPPANIVWMKEPIKEPRISLTLEEHPLLTSSLTHQVDPFQGAH